MLDESGSLRHKIVYIYTRELIQIKTERERREGRRGEGQTERESCKHSVVGV